jgi:hypothetical protein
MAVAVCEAARGRSSPVENDRGSSAADEDAPAESRKSGCVHGDLWQRGPQNDLTVTGGVHAAIAVGAGVARLARAAVVDPATATAAAMLRLGWQLAPGVAGHPLLAELATGVERVRNRLEHAAADALRTLLRRVVDASLTAIDLTELVRAHVDLDALAAELDVDAVIARADVDAVIARTDLDAIVRTIDLDAIVGRIDIEAIVKTIDLDAIVKTVDLEAIVRTIDLDAIVGRIDIEAIVKTIDLDAIVKTVDLEAIVKTIDLDAIVKTVDLEAIVDRVDLDRVASRIDIDAIISRVDIDQIASGIDLDAIVARIEPDTVVARVDVEAVLDRLDLAAIARQVLEAIDLPGILRESTGAVSSQAARVVRTEGMHADESVSRFIDRVLRRPHTQVAVTP